MPHSRPNVIEDFHEIGMELNIVQDTVSGSSRNNHNTLMHRRILTPSTTKVGPVRNIWHIPLNLKLLNSSQ